MSNITVKSDGTGITVSAQGPQGTSAVIRNVTEVTATYTVLLTDAAVIATGTFTVTLPSLSLSTDEVTIKSALGTITVTGDESETIEGGLTITLTSGQSATLVPTTSNWIVI